MYNYHNKFVTSQQFQKYNYPVTKNSSIHLYWLNWMIEHYCLYLDTSIPFNNTQTKRFNIKFTKYDYWTYHAWIKLYKKNSMSLFSFHMKDLKFKQGYKEIGKLASSCIPTPFSCIYLKWNTFTKCNRSIWQCYNFFIYSMA